MEHGNRKRAGKPRKREEESEEKPEISESYT
jgi:hypothetical protein